MTEPQLLFVESVDANSVPGDTPLEHLRASERIARERGFPALSVVRSDAGHLVTPPGFTDEAFDAHLPAGLAAAARTIESSMWGMPSGADYVAVHWIGAKLEDPEHFLRIEDYRWPMLYVSEPGDPWGSSARPRAVFGRVLDVRFSPDGRRLVWLESVRENHRETCLVWKQEVGSGVQSLVTRIPSATAYFGDMAISLDGRWLLADSETRLVDLETGHSAGLGSGICAACWYPAAGSSVILAAARSDFNEPARIFTLDLSTWQDETVGSSPRPIHGLQVAPDGTLAARMNHQREAERGGWFDELVITSDFFATTETVVAVEEATGWRRRATRPRWTAPWPDAVVRPVSIEDRFEERLRADSPAVGLSSSGAEEALEGIMARIRHRLARIGEEPAQVVAIADELRALTEWSATTDPDLALRICSQVMPALEEALQIAAAAPDSAAARQVEAIGALAARERGPFPALSFG
jgi:hypothetical protein